MEIHDCLPSSEVALIELSLREIGIPLSNQSCPAYQLDTDLIQHVQLISIDFLFEHTVEQHFSLFGI